MNWFEWMFSGSGLIWIGGILAFLAIVALIMVRERRWHVRFDRLPVTTVPARIVAKRAETFGFLGVATRYYATFELASGQRLEFMIFEEYGLLVEGDEGELTYQVVELSKKLKAKSGLARDEGELTYQVVEHRSLFKGFRRLGPSRDAPEGKGPS